MKYVKLLKSNLSVWKALFKRKKCHKYTSAVEIKCELPRTATITGQAALGSRLTAAARTKKQDDNASNSEARHEE